MKARHEFDTDEEYTAYLRTYFTARAISGLMTIYDVSTGTVPNDSNSKYMALMAVFTADALIAELNKEIK